MLIAEELLLACLDPASGRVLVARHKLNPALGAALVVELILAERISVAGPGAARKLRGRVQLVSATPTDDAELDWMLEHLHTWTDLRVAQLVAEVGGVRVVDRLAGRLVSAGVVAPVSESVGGSAAWPTRDPQPSHEITGRIRAALVTGGEPTERTATLITLLDSVGRLNDLVHATDASADAQAFRRRVEELGQGEGAAPALRAALEQSSVSTAASVVRSLLRPNRT